MVPRVFIPHMPRRFDVTVNDWVPSVNVDPARKYGEILVVVDQNIPRTTLAPLLQSLKERMSTFTDEDYLLPLGDPALIAAAAGVALRQTGGLLRMLKWDRFTKDYIVTELKI